MALVLRVAALAVLAVVACAPSDDFEIVSPAGGTAGSAGGTGAKDGGSGGFGALGGVGASGGVGGSGGAAGAAGASGGTAGASGGASGAAGSGSIPTCAALFTGVVGVNQVCTEVSGNCVLAADTDAADGDPGQPCAAICAAAGSACVQVFDNAVAGYCTPEMTVPLDCTTTTDQSNAVCYCSRGCGGGPPCATGSTCSSGQCI